MQAARFSEDVVDAALQRVLSRPEFQPPESGRLATWFGEAREAVLDLIRSLFERLDIVEWGDLTFAWLFRFWLAVVAALLIVHLLKVSIGLHRGRLRVSAAAQSARTESDGEAVDWSAAAERAAREGRYREAILALYQALLERLDRNGLVRYDDAKTPGDYRREMRSDNRGATIFDGFLSIFEPIAFGGRAPDRQTFERLHVLAREMAGD